MRHFNGKIQISRWSIYLLLMILAAGSLYPFIFMFLTSLTQKKIMTASFDFSAMDLRNYKNLLSGFPILTYVKNSLIVVSCACFFNVVIATLAGYAFAKKKFPLKEVIFWLYLATLMMPGQVILIPVFINTIQLFSGTDYRPYDLEGSGFITLTDIEGSDLQLSQNRLYNMDYIAHEGTLLDPESWYFQQYATFGENDSPSDVPNLEITITRYTLNMLAEMRVAELSRQKFDNSGDYQKFDVLDECLYAKREGWTHTSEITGETRTFLPGGILVLRRGNTVLFANYYGSQDLSEHIEHFAQMLVNL